MRAPHTKATTELPSALLPMSEVAPTAQLSRPSSSHHAIEAVEQEALLERSPVIVASSGTSSKTSLPGAIKVLVYCGLYLGIGPTLIIVNRTLLKEVHRPCPRPRHPAQL